VAADIRYARNGGVAIAYRVLGDGDTDLAYVPDFVSKLVCGWEPRHWRGFDEQLAHVRERSRQALACARTRVGSELQPGPARFVAVARAGSRAT
jgi:hypothetical protein